MATPRSQQAIATATQSQLLFCPSCATILMAEDDFGSMSFKCKICMFKFRVERTITKSMPLSNKVVDDVLGGEDAWKNVDKTEPQSPCPQCGHNEAFFQAIQIRSADEPTTEFYRCTKCANVWNSY